MERTKPPPCEHHCNGSNCPGFLVLQAKRLPPQPDTVVLSASNIVFHKYLAIQS